MKKKKHIVAVASSGGHWIELKRLIPSFKNHRVTYISTIKEYGDNFEGSPYYCVKDATRWDKIGLIKLAFQLLFRLIALKPDVIITTGAAPGYFALLIGKIIGAKTIWVDSIANAEVLSLSGQKISKTADICLTQWEELADEKTILYRGSVL